MEEFKRYPAQVVVKTNSAEQVIKGSDLSPQELVSLVPLDIEKQAREAFDLRAAWQDVCGQKQASIIIREKRQNGNNRTEDSLLGFCLIETLGKPGFSWYIISGRSRQEILSKLEFPAGYFLGEAERERVRQASTG